MKRPPAGRLVALLGAMVLASRRSRLATGRPAGGGPSSVGGAGTPAAGPSDRAPCRARSDRRSHRRAARDHARGARHLRRPTLRDRPDRRSAEDRPGPRHPTPRRGATPADARCDVRLPRPAGRRESGGSSRGARPARDRVPRGPEAVLPGWLARAAGPRVRRRRRDRAGGTRVRVRGHPRGHTGDPHGRAVRRRTADRERHRGGGACDTGQDARDDARSRGAVPRAGSAPAGR